MIRNLPYGVVLLSALFPLLAEAKPCIGNHMRSSVPDVCDVSFTVIPTFANLCLDTIQTGTYTIINNTPVTVKLNYIRIQSNDALPAAATSIIAAPTNNCGSSLAAGASCNIVVTLQPRALGTYNRVLQIGIDTRQVSLAAPAITAAVNCTPTPPPCQSRQ